MLKLIELGRTKQRTQAFASLDRASITAFVEC
jgi:hypothetical protein